MAKPRTPAAGPRWGHGGTFVLTEDKAFSLASAWVSEAQRLRPEAADASNPVPAAIALINTTMTVWAWVAKRLRIIGMRKAHGIPPSLEAALRSTFQYEMGRPEVINMFDANKRAYLGQALFDRAALWARAESQG